MILLKKNKSGFTLVEVLIAIAIFALSLVALTTSWYSNELKTRKARVATQAALLLEQNMAEFEMLYENENLSSLPEEESGDFGEDYPNYRWSFESQEFTMPDLSQALISSGEEQANQQMMLMIMQQMKGYFSEAIKEAKVTIYVKIRDKEARYSATTYFVDYDTPLSVPGVGAGP